MSFLSRSACLAAASLVVIVAGQSSQGALIINEQFLTGSTPSAGQYDTTLTLNSSTSVPTVQGMASTGWVSGAGTSQTHVVAGTLDAPAPTYEAGGKVQFNSSPVDTNYRSNARATAAFTNTTGHLYLSGMVSTDAFPVTPANTGLRGYALMGFSNATGVVNSNGTAATGTLLGYYLGFRANATDGVDLVIRHRQGTTASPTGVQEDVVVYPNANPGTTYQFILRTDVNVIGGNQEVVTYWVNPTDTTSEVTATATALATGTFNDYSMQAGDSTDIARLTVATYKWDANSYFDEMRVGTAFADVAPEPASMALLTAPALFALRRRRAC